MTQSRGVNCRTLNFEKISEDNHASALMIGDTKISLRNWQKRVLLSGSEELV